MDFEYNGKNYMLTELYEVGGKASHDIIAIFEITLDEDGMEKYNFVDYFCGADDSEEVLIDNAKKFIDLKINA
jgi:hypothetical protein